LKTEKRDEIVKASLELIAEHGFHGAPMAMIAERAGVGAGTIYRYFESKDVLIAELFREFEAKIYGVVMEGYDPATSIRERFLHLGTALLRYFIAHPLEFRYLEQFHNSPFGVAHRRDKFLGTESKSDVFRDLFRDGVTQHVIKDLPLVVLFGLAFGPLLSVARDHILGFIVLDDALIARTVEACCDGIRK
jgi:AcrR family transcriptional regulator